MVAPDSKKGGKGGGRKEITAASTIWMDSGISRRTSARNRQNEGTRRIKVEGRDREAEDTNLEKK